MNNPVAPKQVSRSFLATLPTPSFFMDARCAEHFYHGVAP
jgi:hypothetical protein